MSFKAIFRSARPTSIKAAILGTAALSSLLGMALPAQADVPAKQLAVEYQDLDLTREQDVKRLYSRLRAAARSVCGSLNGRTQFERGQYRECYDESVTNAVNEVNVTQLTKLHGSSSESQRIAQRG
jgi:UrcA family protein